MIDEVRASAADLARKSWSEYNRIWPDCSAQDSGDVMRRACQHNFIVKKAVDCGENGAAGVLEAKYWMNSDNSFRWISGEAECQCGCIIPRVSRPFRHFHKFFCT